MKLSEYFRAFSEEELVRGAEHYLSGDLRNYACEKRKDGTVLLTGSFLPAGKAGKRQEQTCSLRLFLTPCVPAETACFCDEHAANGYGCEHTAALLTAYLTEEQGDEALRGTWLESRLSTLAAVDDPFLPGVLKRTDDRLLSLLHGETQVLPSWQFPSGETVREKLSAACTLYYENGRAFIELRLGAGRKYIMKDLPALLRAYRRREHFPFGKNELTVSPQACDAFAGRLLDFFAELQEIAERASYTSSLFKADGQQARFIVLRGANLDRFMQLCDGETLTIEAEDDVPVEMDRKGLSAVLRRKAHGASLQVTPVRTLFFTDAGVYFKDKQGIFFVGTDTPAQRNALLSLTGWTDALYIRESDISSVTRELLPFFTEHGTLTVKGIDPEDYAREVPKFEFGLDLSEENRLTCTPFALYPKQDLRCLLYDSNAFPARRNGQQEALVHRTLQSIFPCMDRSTLSLYIDLTEDGLYRFLKDAVPQLEALGTVLVTDSLREAKVRALPAASVGIAVRSGNLMLSLKGEDLSPQELDEILSAYSRKKKYYRLKRGAFISFEDSSDASSTWETLAELYRQYGHKNPENISLPVYRALYLQEMVENREGALVSASREYRKLVSAMDPAQYASAALPSSLQGQLRPYQEEGYRWITMLRACRFGGILADDMGLGKTLQALAFLLSEKEQGKSGDALRTLIVCPASLVYNWQKELETFTPALTSVVIAGTAGARKALMEASRDTDVWITSYDLLKRDIALYEGLPFANEIIDEAQFIKNQNTQAAQAVRVIQSSFRLALTGTPIENRLSELWSIMDYLMPGFLDSYTRFQKDYEAPIVTQKDENAMARLRTLVHPFILRRLKKDVLKELPDKLEESVTVRLTGEQRKLYDAAVSQIRLDLDKATPEEFRTGKLQLLSQLTRLRQICCDPSLLYENYSAESAKLEACLQLIRQAVDGGHKLLLFSQFTSMLDILCARLRDEGLAYHRIDGSTPKQDRMALVDSFANDDVPVFCISLKAGGTGLNLTAADIVIHYDPWWNQAAQNQATDRTHRIGQTQRVTVYELIAADTIEEQIQTIKADKSRLAEDVLSGESISSSILNKEDLLALLG